MTEFLLIHGSAHAAGKKPIGAVTLALCPDKIIAATARPYVLVAHPNPIAGA